MSGRFQTRNVPVWLRVHFLLWFHLRRRYFQKFIFIYLFFLGGGRRRGPFGIFWMLGIFCFWSLAAVLWDPTWIFKDRLGTLSTLQLNCFWIIEKGAHFGGGSYITARYKSSNLDKIKIQLAFSTTAVRNLAQALLLIETSNALVFFKSFKLQVYVGLEMKSCRISELLNLRRSWRYLANYLLA